MANKVFKYEIGSTGGATPIVITWTGLPTSNGTPTGTVNAGVKPCIVSFGTESNKNGYTNDVLIVTFNDEENCSGVFPLTGINAHAVDDEGCEDDQPITINNPCSDFNIAASYNSGTNSIAISPSGNAGAIVEYTFTNLSGCTGWFKQVSFGSATVITANVATASVVVVQSTGGFSVEYNFGADCSNYNTDIVAQVITGGQQATNCYHEKQVDIADPCTNFDLSVSTTYS